VAPFWDPVWLVEGADDPDTVLEARSQLWHVNRLTRAVTVSDIIAGEDGTIEIGDGDHFYDDMRVSFGETPLRRVSCQATVTWTQQGAGDMHVEATIGCTIGYGGAVSTDPGTNGYVETGYVEDGYLAAIGATIDPGTSDVTYQGFDDLDVVDDDGLNLLDLRAADVVSSLSVTGGCNDQVNVVSNTHPPDDPVTALQQVPTVVSLTLLPVTGRSFHTDFAPTVAQLVVPKTIDLEAALKCLKPSSARSRPAT
jgi:hypothetical protein